MLCLACALRLGKGNDVPVVGVGHHAHFTLDGSNLLLRGGLSASHTEERHDGGLKVGEGGVKDVL